MQPDLLLGAFSLAVLVLSIIVHEVAHGYAANALGDPTAKLAGRLTLNPLPHVDLVGSVLIPAFLVLTQSSLLFGWAKPVPYNPNNLNKSAFARRWGEFTVSIAGVATNLAIAVLFGLIARAAAAGDMPVFAGAAAIVCLTNLYLGLFNLIPIPPFDGFGVLRGALPYKLAIPLERLEERLASGGILTLVIVLLAFSYFLAAPFASFVGYLFGVLVGQ
jgi:Zn-dependent protease